jgi:tetratricopeptide (TPR) repeat protein
MPATKRPRKPSRRKSASRRKRSPADKQSASQDAALFYAEAAYADSMFRMALGDEEGCVEALRRCLATKPDYAPGLLSWGSVEYQLRNASEGLRLFLSLLDLPDGTEDLPKIVDEAGEFLIKFRAYQDGLELYRRAAVRFPGQAVFLQGQGCCASEIGLHEEAIVVSRAAIELEPENQELVNDLGWSLLLARKLKEAHSQLKKAVAMKPEDELAAENLRVCEEEMRKARGK